MCMYISQSGGKVFPEILAATLQRAQGRDQRISVVGWAGMRVILCYYSCCYASKFAETCPQADSCALTVALQEQWFSYIPSQTTHIFPQLGFA